MSSRLAARTGERTGEVGEMARQCARILSQHPGEGLLSADAIGLDQLRLILLAATAGELGVRFIAKAPGILKCRCSQRNYSYHVASLSFFAPEALRDSALLIPSSEI